jgi:hypothetical protein
MSYRDTENHCIKLVTDFTFSDANWNDKLIGIELGRKEIEEIQFSTGCFMFSSYVAALRGEKRLSPEEWTFRGDKIIPVNKESHISLSIRGA